jgi:hypothetical protein
VKSSTRQLNKRCPCGSGKAFKNCHGQEFLLPKTPRVARYAEQQEDCFVEPPGYTYNTFVGVYEDGRYAGDPLGSPGEYEAQFTLLQPGQAAERVVASGTTRIWEVQNEKIEGDSHLALTIPKDARPSSNAEAKTVALITVGRRDGGADEVGLVLEPNREGRLSKVIVTLEAESFSDAENRAYYEASAFLSSIAFELDIPLRIAHTLIKETATKSVRVGFVRQFGYKGAGNLPEHAFLDRGAGLEMKGRTYEALTSIYREALNSESPFYQFLCFCRVVQRLKEKLRPRWQKAIAGHDRGLMPSYPKCERFPASGEKEAERFPESVAGKKFNLVYDERLRPLRNGIGHVFLEDSGDESSAERSGDEHEFVDEVYALLPAAHHVARTMLKNDFGQGGLAQRALALEHPPC